MELLKNLGLLFLSMLKIGLFTFGGGHAMISLLENEFVTRKKWLDSEEFLDLVTIAETTPGPIAINCATYIGYKRAKMLGAIVGTLGIVLPSFVIIFVISLFFNQFLAITWVAAAFKGIQICAVFLILSAGIKMLKKVPRTPLNLILLVGVFVCMVLLSLFAVNFSSIFYILIAGGIGLMIYAIGYIRGRKERPLEPEALPDEHESRKEEVDQ